MGILKLTGFKDEPIDDFFIDISFSVTAGEDMPKPPAPKYARMLSLWDRDGKLLGEIDPFNLIDGMD